MTLSREIWKRQLLKRLTPRLDIKVNSPSERIASSLEKDALACEIGCGDRRLFSSIINVDIYRSNAVDVLADAQNLPFRSNIFDCVFLVSVLEHVQKPWVVAQEISRILKTGGKVLVDSPFFLSYHSYPEDYWRFTTAGYRQLFENFDEIESGPSVGPASAIAMALPQFAFTLTENRYFKGILYFMVSWIIFPLKYLDNSLINRKEAYKLAACNYYVGKKRLKS